MKKGLLRIPNYLEEINPPSLWAYYYTLPSWVRNEPLIKNIMMGVSYRLYILYLKMCIMIFLSI
jgi:hypothetical protein